MSRWLAAAPLVVLALLALLFGGYALNHDPKVQPKALVGKAMPHLTLPSLETGQDVRLADATAGGPVLINFFASWCGPCAVEQPELMALKARHVRVIGVAYKDPPASTQGFLARLGDPFAARLVDRDGRAGIEFGITGVPETFLVANGKVLAKHTGPMSPAEADQLAAQALTPR